MYIYYNIYVYMTASRLSPSQEQSPKLKRTQPKERQRQRQWLTRRRQTTQKMLRQRKRYQRASPLLCLPLMACHSGGVTL